MFKWSLLLKKYLQRTQYYTKVIKTEQRSLTCFRPIESNEEKRKRFD